MYQTFSIPRETRALTTALAILLASGGAAHATAQEADYVAPPQETESENGYGYFRVLDGSATLVQAGTGERTVVQTNEPVLVGDQIFLSRGRAEIVLADRNMIRIGDEAELGLEALAGSPERDDRATVIELRRGKLQLVVVGEALGEEFPTILTPNATIRVLARGSYFVDLDGGPRTELVVRDGRAEVLTVVDAAEVRVGEELKIEGRSGDRFRYTDARGLDGLERWGRDLAYYAEGEYRDYVDRDLHYSASSLYGHGSWVTIGATWAWRPYVSAGWLPYTHGRWRYTPTGMFWVSYEPWGWVPYHYGSWDFAAGYGWVWYPGRYFRPAHVYWYWGSSYAGWIPSGYYNRHYGAYYGSRFGPYGGVYGYLGGSFGPYRHWVFSPLGRLGHRQQHRYVFNGYELSNRERTLGRGILTTDTRHLRPELWRRPTEALHALRRAGGATAARDLPDARPFVERVAKLPPTLERRALRDTDRAATPGRAVRADAADIESRSPRALPRQSGTQLERGGIGERAAREVPTVGTDRNRDRLRQPETRSGRAGAVEPGGRAATPERARTAPTVNRPESARRPEARAGDESAERSVRRPTVQDSRGEAAARRPTTQRPTATERPTATQRPTTARPQERTTINRQDASRPTVQRPQARPTGQPAERPQARPAPRPTSRPTARPQARPTSQPTARPQARPTPRPQARPAPRPQARPAPRPTSQPTARPQARPTPRPQARPAPRPQARPAPRPSSSPRPQARPASRPAPRPQARPASRPSSSPRPQAGPASRPAPRPQARPSGGGSRPAVRPSSRPRPRPNG